MLLKSCFFPMSALALLVGCGEAEGGPQSLTVEFDLRFGATSVACGDVLEGVGVTASNAELLDARLYLHDLRALLEDGTDVPLKLEESDWQRDGVVLLDFADDTGLCETGSPEVNRQIQGSVPEGSRVEGLAFQIGLPDEQNHLDAARAPLPLSAPGMAWSWVGGFKYARIDIRSDGNEGWFIHMGATSCEGTPATGISCAFGNRPMIEVRGLDRTRPRIAIDLEELYAGSDVDASIDYVTDFIAGCMAFAGDPECPPIFEALGLEFESNDRSTQRVFAGG